MKIILLNKLEERRMEREKETRPKIYKALLFLVVIIGSVNAIGKNQNSDWIEEFTNPSDLNNWRVSLGNWTIHDGMLEAQKCEDVSGVIACSIWHNQTEITGVWSFDILHVGNETAGTIFYFIGNGVNTDKNHPYEGYAIRLKPAGDIYLDYAALGSLQNSPGYYIESHPFIGWRHIEVTRNQTGYMKVFLNGTEIFHVIHDLVTSSENIFIYTRQGVLFDNISYSETLPETASSMTSNSNNSTASSENVPSWLIEEFFFSFIILIATVKKSRNT